ncbi:fatty acid desaturase [Aurantiacibacter luteus]|nr:fatty acid desaturase [Aurantiacibacter luteus]
MAYLLAEGHEPHAERRRAILRAHPEIRDLLGPEPRTFWCIALVWLAQMAAAALAAQLPVWAMVLAAYCVGAVVALALWTLLHECTHDLVFGTVRANRMLGLVASLPLVLPVAESFRKYHLLHHRHPGDPVLDGDVASAWECRLVGNSAWRKALWLMAGPLMQSLRPGRMTGVPLADRAMVTNLLAQLVFDLAVVALLGWQALAYLFLANCFALGLHPLGGRWIQEHYALAPGQETFSYYGPMNRAVFNAGYHVEHHDMPRIPWNRLPRLRVTASEFYDGLYAHRSWSALLLRFITDPAITLESRMVRPANAPNEVRPA